MRFKPCLPKGWGGAELTIDSPRGKLEVKIDDPLHLGLGAVRVSIDGQCITGNLVPYPGPGEVSHVLIELKKRTAKRGSPGQSSPELAQKG